MVQNKTKQKTAPKRKSTAKSGKRKNAGKSRTSSLKYNKVTIFVAIIAVISIILGIVAFHNEDRAATPAFFSTDATQLAGIDVSQHNGKIDWHKVKDEADFAFIRAGYRGYGDGKIYKDKKAKTNLKNANKNDVPVGVYFYSQAINEEEAEKEAQYLIDTVKDYDIDLPLVIDFEYAMKNGRHTGRLHNADLTNKERTKLVNAFCKKVSDAGYTPGIYASTYVYETQFNVKDLDKKAVIWVADYNKEMSYTGEYDIWQYSEHGTCSGINSNDVDLNYWYLG